MGRRGRKNCRSEIEIAIARWKFMCSKDWVFGLGMGIWDSGQQERTKLLGGGDGTLGWESEQLIGNSVLVLNGVRFGFSSVLMKITKLNQVTEIS